jgi:dolichol kinase
MISLEYVLRDTLLAIPLFIYVLIIVSVVTKKLYNLMTSKGLPHNVAVYYNRKVIHISTGGLIALLVPILFKEPLVPFIFASILGFTTLYPHLKHRELDWFQTRNNMYEVNFCFAWGASILILWLVLGDPWKAVIPALLISFGDAVTGIVRNALFGRRTKHWVGNVAMATLCIPMCVALAGAGGGITAAVASFVERFEANPIDDNLLISATATVLLILFHLVGLV